MANNALAEFRKQQAQGGNAAPEHRGQADNMYSLNMEMANQPSSGGRNRREERHERIELWVLHPREYNYCQMWTATFCPNFTIWSFTFLNVIIQFIVFLASLFYT